MKNDTKIKALMKQIESGKLKTDMSRILHFIIHEKYSSRPLICDALGISIQTGTARISDLLDMGLIEITNIGQKDDYHIYKYQSDPIRQVDNAYNRRKSKFNQWKKRGLEEFSEFLGENQLEFDLK